MQTLLEQTMPVYDFRERHSRRIDASPTHVWQALTDITEDQLTITRALSAIRRGGTHPDGSRKLLRTEGSLRVLMTAPPAYALCGLIARPWQRRPEHCTPATLDEFTRFDEPEWTKCLTDFHVQPRSGGVLLTTETRGYSTNSAARRRFAIYWVLIRTGSGLIRRDMLAAVARHAARAEDDPRRRLP